MQVIFWSLLFGLVVVFRWHTYCLPHPPGFKAQSMAGKIPAVWGGWVTAEGCCLATGGNLLMVVCSQCICCTFICSIQTEVVISSHQVFVSNEHVSTYHCSFNEGVFSSYRSNPIIETVNPLCYSASRSFFGCGARSSCFLYSEVLIYPHIIFQGPLIFSDDLTIVQCYSRWCCCTSFVLCS